MPELDTVMTTLLLAATLSFGEWLMGNPINAYTFERWAIILIPASYTLLIDGYWRVEQQSGSTTPLVSL